jgi:8-oxo-dGTP pyrophosphatase MutT (NUDIX family)
MSNAADNTHSAPSVPRPAATILLLREGSADVEVLVARRHANLTFGGQWVFPGGTSSASDSSAAALALIGSHGDYSCNRMHSLEGQPLSTTECLGLAMAACRETFEETGILLATDSRGRPCAPEVAGRLQMHRPHIVEQPSAFVELLAQEALRPDISQLVYWAHWITPSVMPRRFDTRFFVVGAPPSQPVIPDSHETVETAWLPPAQLIEAAQRGEMPLSNPTLYNLYEVEAALQRHRTLSALLAAEASRAIAPVMPKMLRDGGSTTILLPWNPAYSDAAGEGVPAQTQYPEALSSLPSLIRVAN